MSEESAAARLERYRNAWRNTPGVADLAPSLPDSGRLEQLWAWSDFAAQACLRHPSLLAELHASGLLDRPCREPEMARALATMLVAAQDEAGLEAALRRFRQRQMVRRPTASAFSLSTFEATW